MKFNVLINLLGSFKCITQKTHFELYVDANSYVINLYHFIIIIFFGLILLKVRGNVRHNHEYGCFECNQLGLGHLLFLDILDHVTVIYLLSTSFTTI